MTTCFKRRKPLIREEDSEANMAKKNYDYLFKILLIGDSGIGKTELLFKFSQDVFSDVFVSTIGIDFKIKTIELQGKKIRLQIWDTAGQERFHTITTSYYRGAMGIILVYDIAQEKTFENISKWLKNVEEHAPDDAQVIIIGNKYHMENNRMVTKEQGQQMANKRGLRFFEVSTETNENIKEAFYALAEDILAKQLSRHNAEEPSNTFDIQDDEPVQKKGCF